MAEEHHERGNHKFLRRFYCCQLTMHSAAAHKTGLKSKRCFFSCVFFSDPTEMSHGNYNSENNRKFIISLSVCVCFSFSTKSSTNFSNFVGLTCTTSKLNRNENPLSTKCMCTAHTLFPYLSRCFSVRRNGFGAIWKVIWNSRAFHQNAEKELNIHSFIFRIGLFVSQLNCAYWVRVGRFICHRIGIIVHPVGRCVCCSPKVDRNQLFNRLFTIKGTFETFLLSEHLPVAK